MIANTTKPLAVRRVLPLLLVAGLAAAGGVLDFWADSGNWIAHLNLVTDVRDDRRLAGISDHIFIGRVTGNLGRTTSYGTPQTDFRVEVLKSLKGSLPAIVKIRDDGSTTGKNGGVWIYGDALVLPELGKSYLFATLHDEEANVHRVVSGGYGRLEITGSENLDVFTILTSQPALELETRFAHAIENEIPFVPGSPGDDAGEDSSSEEQLAE